eukprot:NODE_258_length_11607_cov_1.052659.p4 type:complete len:359 gc:universal NODE_258_length_11607_cov_1.052659:8307-9383(+)
MKSVSVLIFIGAIWLLVIINQYSSPALLEKPERIFNQKCGGPGFSSGKYEVHEIIKEVKADCPLIEQHNPKHEEESCNVEECRAKSGNCNNNKCEWDSGWSLKVDEFNPPSANHYSWEKKGLTPEKLSKHDSKSIPPIFHQSWKNKDVPDRYIEWENSCINHHKHWDHILWTDDDNRQLVASEYPWLLYTYDRLKTPIMKADYIRYVYLYHFGGIYADLDVECLKPSDELIKDRIVVLGELGDDRGFVHNIPNAILASRKGHPFWLFLLNRISMLVHQQGWTEEVTGPIILRDSYLLFQKFKNYKNDFYVAPSNLLYGVDWHRPPANCVAAFGQHLDTDSCKKLFPDAYMITYWTHSW